MKFVNQRHIIALALLLFFLLFFTSNSLSETNNQKHPVINIENVQADQVDSVLAKLSDEQVRSLLIAELSKDVASQTTETESVGGWFGVVVKWLHLFDRADGQNIEDQINGLAAHTSKLPADLSTLFVQLGDEKTSSSAWKNVGWVFFFLILGVIIEQIFKSLTANFRSQFLSHGIPELSGHMRLWAGLMHVTPPLINLAIFASSSLVFFIFSSVAEVQSVNFLFMAALYSIMFIRLGILMSHLFCSPHLSSLRLLPISDNAADKFHKIMLVFLVYIGIGMSLVAFLAELGMPRESFILIVISLGTLLLVLTAAMIIQNKKSIANYILSTDSLDTESSWVMQQFAALWHIPTLMYLFLVWMTFLYQQILGLRQDKGVFLLSLLVVPVFLLLDRAGQWVVQMTVTSLKIYPEDKENETPEDPDELTPQQKERLLIVRVGRVVRLAIILAMGAWVMNLWGYQIPYALNITKIVFRSLVTLAVALFFWTIISGYVERKIKEDEPEEEVSEDQNDEWGAAAQRGRSYTLLPMVRKFIGTALVVMVTFIILSTIGIEIGPLLAGAGVVGLAIGFGAQKLVSDIFSGFFYLLDDAFRVGEYLEAGGVSGAVEGITLRNVMLRHHRGMLQIVPYSDLGPITNYMRGGIVVKFNLEFPYDTDIDQVRKVIKKVGQAMLNDEEFGEDFIRPVKSQGVREITNSVMVIRVKFTAKPGTHFVIRREAYRRITEALAAKGIHYAHRKVIVEVPGSENLSEEEKQKVAEAGAAAGMAALEQQDKEKGTEGGGSTSGMPDM